MVGKLLEHRVGGLEPLLVLLGFVRLDHLLARTALGVRCGVKRAG